MVAGQGTPDQGPARELAYREPDLFILPATQGLVVGIALIAREALRVRRIRKLQDLGVVVPNRTEWPERA